MSHHPHPDMCSLPRLEVEIIHKASSGRFRTPAGDCPFKFALFRAVAANEDTALIFPRNFAPLPLSRWQSGIHSLSVTSAAA